MCLQGGEESWPYALFGLPVISLARLHPDRHVHWSPPARPSPTYPCSPSPPQPSPSSPLLPHTALPHCPHQLQRMWQSPRLRLCPVCGRWRARRGARPTAAGRRELVVGLGAGGLRGSGQHRHASGVHGAQGMHGPTQGSQVQGPWHGRASVCGRACCPLAGPCQPLAHLPAALDDLQGTREE